MNSRNYNNLEINDTCIYNNRNDGAIDTTHSLRDGAYAIVLGKAFIKGGSYIIYKKDVPGPDQVGIALAKSFTKVTK